MDPNTLTRTRLAPTPSGFLHLGNVLSFAITAGLAERSHARILLRIDDLDRQRIRKQYVQDVFDTLNFLEIPWHEGPSDPRDHWKNYAQVHRMHLYKEALLRLRESGCLFACTCSRTSAQGLNGCRDKQIPYNTENVSWRLRTNGSGGLAECGLPASMQDFIVRRKDGLPSYQLASVVDDLYFGIDLVVRGADLLESTIAQRYLAAVLKETGYAAGPAEKAWPGRFSQIAFHHHRLVLHPDGTKLCKSTGSSADGEFSVAGLRKMGKKRKDIFMLIGSLLQVREPVQDWQSLAAAVLTRP